MTFSNEDIYPSDLGPQKKKKKKSLSPMNNGIIGGNS